MSKQTKSNLGVFALLVLGVAGAGVLAFYVQAGHNRVPSEDRKAATGFVGRPGSTSAAASQTGTATVLTPTMVGTELVFKKQVRQAPAGTDPMVFAVNEYLRQVPAVPSDARLVGADVRDHTATLSFNHQFGDQSYGSEDEKTILDGLRATLGEFPDVEQFWMQVEGKPIDSLGHVELNEALPVIRLATAAPSKPSEAQQSRASR